MKVSEIISAHKGPFPSLEIVPPLKGVSREELLDAIRPYMEFAPPFINVTCHRDEWEYTANADGTFSRRPVRKRVSETAVCTAIKSEFDVEVVPHILCGGSTAEETENLLNDLKFLGIDNVMALRGDCLIGERRFTPEPNGYSYANELVEAIQSFSETSGKDFCIGVAGYPEKHFEAPNLETDIKNLKRKVDAGADFIITQMFFDNSVFYAFRDKCRDAGIEVPIIPGLKPLSNAKQLSLIPEAFSIDIPQELVSEMTAHADDKEACYLIGQEWCAAQCEDLLKHGVPAVHFYTMGKPGNIINILKKNF